MPDDLRLDQIRAMAADIGLSQCTEEHLEQLMRATRAARARRTALRTDALEPVNEPAHVFRLGAEVVR